MGHALFVIDYIVAQLDERKRHNAEKDIVRAKIDIYSGKTFETTINSLLISLYPEPAQSPYSLASPSFSQQTP